MACPIVRASGRNTEGQVDEVVTGVLTYAGELVLLTRNVKPATSCRPCGKRRAGRGGSARDFPARTGKPPGEKFIMKAFKFPPALWEAFASIVPTKERSATLRAYMQREIEKRKGKKPPKK